MRSVKQIHIVGCHAEGEVGDVVVGGVAPPPGETLWAQSRYIAEEGSLRAFLLNEPRGGVFRHVNLLVPPKDPRADMGFIIMEPADTPPMSGSNSLCVATVLLETGMIAMREPETRLTLEAPGGLVPVIAECRDGRVTRVRVTNLPAFADRLAVPLEVAGLGTVTVDTAFGGDSFVMVEAEALGFALDPSEARELARTGVRIAEAATEQLGFSHPTNPDWAHFSFCQIHREAAAEDGVPAIRNAVAIRPGKIDRSPTGTALSARMAVRHARGEMAVGDRLISRSLIGSRFEGRILGEATVGGRPAIAPEIAGRAYLTGTTQHWLDPEDPFPEGYRIADTWPMGEGR